MFYVSTCCTDVKIYLAINLLKYTKVFLTWSRLTAKNNVLSSTLKQLNVSKCFKVLEVTNSCSSTDYDILIK